MKNKRQNLRLKRVKNKLGFLSKTCCKGAKKLYF
jgi:hypothetical protein